MEKTEEKSSKKRNKLILWIISATILVGIVIKFGVEFAPGSYPYAEEYEINVEESKLIEAIQEFKKENPEYNIPKLSQFQDGRHNADDNWYRVYFYYPRESQIIYTWTRPSIEIGKTTFALVRIFNSNGGNSKDFNKDFGCSDNHVEIKKFEDRILNKIKQKLGQ